MKKQLFALAILAAPVAATILSPAFAYAAPAASKLGDLSMFESLADDTLSLVDKGDLKAAQLRITDFESAWDKAHRQMRPLDPNEWGTVDDAADVAIASLRAKKPTVPKAKAAVTALIAAIQNPAGH